MTKPIFIAEIKTQSPYGFKSEIPFVELMHVAITYGDWVSVHTSALWGGDFETISFVRKYTKKPILAKGLHATDDSIRKAFDNGASYALMVDRLFGPHDVDPRRLIREINNFDDVKSSVERNPSCWRGGTPADLKDQKFCCNSRDLKTGLTKRNNELQNYLDLGIWTCQASGIRNMSDVRPEVNAFIVGSHLFEFCKQMNHENK